MSNDLKKKSILKMFASFPPNSTITSDQAAATTAAYLETLRPFSSEIVSVACEALRKRNSHFPPSAGELFTECEKRDIAARKAEEWERLGRPVVRFSLPAPNKSDFTLAELADLDCVVNRVGELPYVMRVDANGNPRRVPHGYNGAGQEASYGYLTPKEVSAGRRLSAQRELSAPLVQTMVDDFKNVIPEEKSGPLWRKPKNELEAEEMRQEALEALDRAPELARQPLTVSDTLMRQFRGELPIGEGKHGLRPLVKTDRDP